MITEKRVENFYRLYKKWIFLRNHFNPDHRQLAWDNRYWIEAAAKRMHLKLTVEGDLELDINSLIKNFNTN